MFADFLLIVVCISIKKNKTDLKFFTKVGDFYDSDHSEYGAVILVAVIKNEADFPDVIRIGDFFDEQSFRKDLFLQNVRIGVFTDNRQIFFSVEISEQYTIINAALIKDAVKEKYTGIIALI